MKKVFLVFSLFLAATAGNLWAQASGPADTILKPPTLASPPFAPRFDYSADEIARIGTASRDLLNKRLAEIVRIPADKRTFENTVLAMEYAFGDFNDAVNLPQFLAYVSENKEVREAGTKLEEESSNYLVEISTRRDLYKAVKEVADKKVTLNPDDQFLLDRNMLDFKRMGLELPDKELEAFKDLKKKIVTLELKFEKNTREVKDTLEFTKEQLAGLPDDYIGKLKTASDGKFIVSLDYPEYFPFMENAKDEEARRLLEFKFSDRCAGENVKIMEETLQLRDQAAKMLGYKNHASYGLDDKMAKNPDNVMSFLNRLHEKLTPKGKIELKSRLELKASETKTPVASEMKAWDWRYWNNQFRKTNLAIDQEKVKEYFPSDKVVAEMLKIWEEVFDVKFQKAELPVWHKDVVGYELKDKNGDLIGYFYLDLFPREGKYKHMACFGLMKGHLAPDGVYQKPAAAIVGNFNKPGADTPSLMNHGDVETLFHEFGHVTHNLFTKAKYESFAGTAVARDFVEVPSTMFENWVWTPEVLKRISGHYKTGDKIPDDLIKKLIDNKNFDSGMFQLRQLFFSKYDITLHTAEKTDTTDVYKKMMQEIMFIPMTEGAHPQASFGHLMGGYDAGYYGYMWARAISSDLFTAFQKDGLFSPEVGRKYRELILAPGRVTDQDAQIEKFLGRKFNEDAFVKNLGLAQ